MDFQLFVLWIVSTEISPSSPVSQLKIPNSWLSYGTWSKSPSGSISEGLMGGINGVCGLGGRKQF